jgi:hypothetical protein
MTLAQAPLGRIGGNDTQSLGPFAGVTGELGGAEALVNVVSNLIGLFTILGAIWFLLQFVFAGYEWMSAGGDTKKIAAARDRITHAFIGLLIVVASWAILAVVGQFLGFNTLVDPQKFIDSVQLGK